MALDLTRFRIPWINRRFIYWLAPLLKDDERRRFTGATFMVIGALFSFLLFGPQVAVAALLFLALGRPCRGLGRKAVAGPKDTGQVSGGDRRLYPGLSGGNGSADRKRGNRLSLGAVGRGSAVAGLVELASLPPDDNLSIPLIAGAAMYFLGV